jgi:hypothetical protein|tara:strand:- start:272 stop:439 length:168 start_codon:yes stop_codon:yes gene_type:complete
VQDRSKIPEYEASLTAALSVNNQKTLEADCAAHMHAFNAMAKRLYLNWLQTAPRA